MDSTNILSVVVAGDEGIAPGLFATIASIAVSCSPSCRIDMNYLNTGLKEVTLEKLRRFAAQFGNMNLIVHEVDLSVFHGATLMKGGYSAYARILFRRYVKASRILYLDTDFLVTKDVSELFRMDMGDNVALATMTPTIPLLSYDCPFYSPEEIKDVPYFNSGILLINGDAWEAQHCEEIIIEKLRTGVELHYHDQTLLNYVLKGKWSRLADEWGLMMIHNTNAPLNTNYHFGGGAKPWQKGCTFIAAGLWWVLYEARIKPYYTLPHDKAIRNGIKVRESAVYYLLPFAKLFLAHLPKIGAKIGRLVERRKYYKIFSSAEKKAMELWDPSNKEKAI